MRFLNDVSATWGAGIVGIGDGVAPDWMRLPARSLMRPGCWDRAEDLLEIIESHADDTASGMDRRQDAGGDSPSKEVDADPIHGSGVLE